MLKLESKNLWYNIVLYEDVQTSFQQACLHKNSSQVVLVLWLTRTNAWTL